MPRTSLLKLRESAYGEQKQNADAQCNGDWPPTFRLSLRADPPRLRKLDFFRDCSFSHLSVLIPENFPRLT